MVPYHFKWVNSNPLMGESLFLSPPWMELPSPLSNPLMGGEKGEGAKNSLFVPPPCLRATHRQVKHPTYLLILHHSKI